MNVSLCRDSTLASPTPEKRHWEFPELEIPEAPLHHGGAPLFLLIQEEISVDKTYVRVHHKFLRVREVDLHLSKPLGGFIVKVPVERGWFGTRGL